MDEIKSFCVDDIEVPAGRRVVDAGKVAALAESIRLLGLQTPPTVRWRLRDDGENDIVLVAGAHRLEAVKSLGERFIQCAILEEGVDAELWEIDENLCRNELSASERAELTARRKVIYERIHPEAKAQVRQAHVKHGADANLAPAFTADTAKATGQSERKVQRDVERGTKVSPEALAAVQGTELDTGAFLDRLKRQPRESQVAYVEAAKINAKADKEIDDAVETRDVEDLAARLIEWLTIEQQEYVAAALDRLPGKKIAKVMRRRVAA